MSQATPLKYCDFKVEPAPRPGWFIFVCIHCGNARVLPNNAKLMALCGKPRPLREPCAHRTETTIRTDYCKTCCGNIRIKVYGCAVLGECTISRCQNCEHHKIFQES